MGNQKDRGQSGRMDPDSSVAQRDAGAEQRIEQRRQHDKEISKREDDGFDQPESSAQKTPNPGPQP